MDRFIKQSANYFSAVINIYIIFTASNGQFRGIVYLLIYIIETSGMTTIAADGLLLLSSATFTDEVTAGSLNERTSVLTITENNEVYNGILKCVATWSDISLSVDSETDVMAVGARMDQYTFDTGSGEAVLSCVVWGDSAPFSVEWIDEDDAAITNEADKVFFTLLLDTNLSPS